MSFPAICVHLAQHDCSERWFAYDRLVIDGIFLAPARATMAGFLSPKPERAPAILFATRGERLLMGEASRNGQSEVVRTMASIEQRLALRERLQTVENNLIAAGRRNVTVECTAGAFTWVQQGAGREPNQPVSFVEDIQPIEDLIMSEGHAHLVIMTGHGTFTWRLRLKD